MTPSYRWLRRDDLPEEAVSRFLARVRHHVNGCWTLSDSPESMFYATVQMGDRSHPAHRIMWVLTWTDIPPRLEVCHSCDNPGCCNPAHLWLGTHQQNLADAGRKGRIRPYFGPTATALRNA